MRKALSSLLRLLLLRYEITCLLTLIALFAIGGYLNRALFDYYTLSTLLTFSAEVGIIAVGVAFLMISGEFDMSVGAVGALTAISFITLINSNLPGFLALLVSIGLACAIGLINGLITIKSGAPSFIVTLATAFTIRGILLIVTGGFPVSYKGAILPLSVRILGGSLPFGLRLSAIWFVVAVAVMTLVLEFTRYGNHVFATGGNPTVAREMGVNTSRVKLINFVLTSFFASLSGLFIVARLMSADPLLLTGAELEGIAAAVVGGCSLLGGYGSIVGAALGSVLISLIRVTLTLTGAPVVWYRSIVGGILVATALIDAVILRKLRQKFL
ncbi:MAG: ABC transporter permease [Thermofilum sp. ex4484_15]|nr:MAG: ABC transporter permease [Thermofilum sp. ex4484_15]